MRYLGPGSLLTYFHLRDSAWAAAALSDILKQNEKASSSSSMVQSSSKSFPSILLLRFVFPVITLICSAMQHRHLSNGAVNAASQLLSLQIHHVNVFPVRLFLMPQSLIPRFISDQMSEALSIKAARPHLGGNVQVFYGCTKGRKRP